MSANTVGCRGAMRIGSALGVLLLLGLAGCNGAKPETENTTPAPDKTTATTKTGEPEKTPGAVRAALVLDTGGVDDKSFNASAWEGLQRAMKDFGADGTYVESQTAADYKTNLSQYAGQGYDIVFPVGFLMEDALKETAPQFPDTKFAIVDGNAPDAPNCAALQFKEEQATYLAGFLAASMSKTKTIGFVGGQEVALIKRFEAGYRAGARTADPKVKVLASYTQDWNDISKGKSHAQQQFSSGADIIFQAAGKGGLGVIEAAREKGTGFYAIGVDQDQDGLAPGRVLTSVLKRLDKAVYDVVKRVKEKRFTAGKQLYDLKSGSVGLSKMKYTKKDIPADVLSKLDTLTKMVENGEVIPPTTVEAVVLFKPPAL